MSIDVGTEWRACRAIVQHAFHARWNQGSNWLNWVLLGAAVLVPLAALALNGRPSLVLSIGFGAPAGVLVLLWWFMLIGSLLQQNQGQARLVPGIARRSATVLVGAWFGATLGLTLLYAIGGAPVPITAAGIGLALIVIALLSTRPGYFVLCMLLLYFSSKLGFGWIWTDTALLSVMAVAIAVLGPLAVHSVYLRRDVVQLSAGFPLLKLLSQGGVPRQYARKLRRDCERGHIDNLLMHSLGPGTKIFTLAGAVGVGGAALLMAYLSPRLIDYLRTPLMLFVPALMVSFQILGAYTIMTGVYSARREHAVVRLAPRLPGARYINRSLARGVLLEFAWQWLGTTAIVLLTSWLLGADTGRLLQLLAACCVTLPCAGMLLCDYSLPNDARAWVRTVRLVLLVGAFVLMLWAASGDVNVRAWTLAGAFFIAYAASFGWWRWRAMLRSPVALPAGRRG